MPDDFRWMVRRRPVAKILVSGSGCPHSKWTKDAIHAWAREMSRELNRLIDWVWRVMFMDYRREASFPGRGQTKRALLDLCGRMYRETESLRARVITRLVCDAESEG